MNTHHPSRVLAGAALLALLFGFLQPLPARAEGEVPPETAPATETTPPETAATPAPAEDQADPSALPTEPEPPVEDNAQPSPAAPAAPTGGLTEQVPDGTTIAVVDGQGELVPLASAEAAAIAAEADPVWCPASLAAPTPGANGCTASAANLANLVTTLAGAPPAQDGIIWIQAGNDSSVTSVTLNGAALGSMPSYKLTLRGGWDGVSGSKLISGTSTFTARLAVSAWLNDVTLTDIEIRNSPGTAASDALSISTTGNISLTRVNSHNNNGTGARLRNSAGAGSVTLGDSQFSANAGNDGGLYLQSAGKITLASVIASGNTVGGGAYLDNTLGVGTVSVSASRFNSNAGSNGGLYVRSAGAVTLANLTASSNTLGNGAHIINNPGAAGVTLTGVNTFEDNRVYGLRVLTNGAITASDLSANRNGVTSGYGVSLDNQGAATPLAVTLTGTNIFTENYAGGLWINSAGPVKLTNLFAHSNTHGNGVSVANIAAPSPQPVALTGTNSFKYNRDVGLYVASKGTITANNLTASGSLTGNGVTLDNTVAGALGGVTLTGANVFYGNSDNGLAISSDGLIKIANVTATGNGLVGGGYGVTLYNAFAGDTAGISLSGTNVLSGNYSGGLHLATNGPVAISNLTASDNPHGTGADIDNAAGAAAKVKLTGANVFSGNYLFGLYVRSAGALALSNLTASGNGTVGGGYAGVILDNSGAATPQAVTLSGTNRFDNNDASGLRVTSLGAISLSNVTARANGLSASSGYGLWLTNELGSGGGVTLSGVNLLSGNYHTGALITSSGPVSLARLTASNNPHGQGVRVDNTYSGADNPQKVSLTGSGTFLGNGYGGLQIDSHGPISLANLTASDNGAVASGYGASLVNSSSASPQAVTLSGASTFNANSDGGLLVDSRGVIKISNLTASQNDGRGAGLSNAYDGSTGGVTLSGKNTFLDNSQIGLEVASRGLISGAYLTASGNGLLSGAGGASLNNSSALTAQPVKLTGVNQFNANYSVGLNVLSIGAITISSLSASDSVNNAGATLSNNLGAATAPVTLSGVSLFEDNHGLGLHVQSYGAISLNTTRLEASGNGVGGSWGGGVLLSNVSAATPMKVAATGALVLTGNYWYGLRLEGSGPISLANLTATGTTHGDGVNLFNNVASATPSAVALSGKNVFSDNYGNGLVVNSYGPITLSQLTATGNGTSGAGGGAGLSNSGSAVPQPVKITASANLSGNAGDGLSVNASGAITVKNLVASGNSAGAGATLLNDFAASSGGVTLSGTNVFDDNFGHGLSISSKGAITANNLTASRNGIGGASGYGANLANTAASTPQSIKLTGSNTFNDNFNQGLLVYSRGAISINNLTASHNLNGSGAELTNNLGTAGVTLTGASTFSENDGTGLRIQSTGLVALTRLTADGNALDGLHVSGNASGVTVTCGSFTANGGYGVYASSTGLVKLIGVVASGNGIFDYGGSLPFTIVWGCPLP